jgi:iron complex outermembrane receptor protein
VTATASYTIPLGESAGNVVVAGTITHTDAQNATSPTASAFYRLPATNLVNVNVDWKGVLGQPIDLSFFMTNLTNRIYPVGIGSAWSSGFESYLVAPPRMFGFRARYRFGA